MGSVDFTGKKAVFLVENGFCEREFLQAQAALKGMGVDCRIISSDHEVIKGWNEEKVPSQSYWGDSYAVDTTLAKAIPADYDILVIPGGKRSIAKLELDKDLKAFAGSFMHTHKPVIAYNYAIDLLMYIDVLAGYSVAAKDSLCDSVKTVGARCAAPEFVVSKNLITLSRYREVGDKLQSAIEAVLHGEKYVEKVVSQENMPNPHKAA